MPPSVGSILRAPCPSTAPLAGVLTLQQCSDTLVFHPALSSAFFLPRGEKGSLVWLRECVYCHATQMTFVQEIVKKSCFCLLYTQENTWHACPDIEQTYECLKCYNSGSSQLQCVCSEWNNMPQRVFDLHVFYLYFWVSLNQDESTVQPPWKNKKKHCLMKGMGSFCWKFKNASKSFLLSVWPCLFSYTSIVWHDESFII